MLSEQTVRPIFVSILARPEGRALPRRVYRRWDGYDVSILARPEGRALPATTFGYLALRLFQSSPGPKDGRYVALQVRCDNTADCFNPRPARRTGATKRKVKTLAQASVSILARPEGRALRWGRALDRRAWRVSILARPEGRALPFYCTRA